LALQYSLHSSGLGSNLYRQLAWIAWDNISSILPSVKFMAQMTGFGTAIFSTTFTSCIPFLFYSLNDYLWSNLDNFTLIIYKTLFVPYSFFTEILAEFQPFDFWERQFGICFKGYRKMKIRKMWFVRLNGHIWILTLYVDKLFD